MDIIEQFFLVLNQHIFAISALLNFNAALFSLARISSQQPIARFSAAILFTLVGFLDLADWSRLALIPNAFACAILVWSQLAARRWHDGIKDTKGSPD